jgi:nucleoside-diphosphate-sugar epimerase
MRVFLTGATGFIGSAIIPELINAGHQVLGLTRSDAGAKSLHAAGAEPHHGSLEDLESLKSGAAKADGVIHCAFDHDFSDFIKMCEKERVAVEALGGALVGSNRPLVITSGVGLGISTPGEPASEDFYDPHHANPRKVSEKTGNTLAERGVNVSFVRLPQVHDTRKQGLITYALQIAREKKISAYVGEGLNRFSAAHVLDVARLYRLVLEKQQPGSRYNAVAEEGITMREIAEVLGAGLNVPVRSLSPEEAQAHFGWMAMFASFDLPASSVQTQQRLNWHPTGPGLIADLKAMHYNT